MKLISSHGPPDKLMVVGDYPTNGEYSKGNSFDGPPGSLLNQLFSPYHIRSESLFRTHYYKVPISGYSSPIKAQKATALASVQTSENWDALLKEELVAIEPNCILALGELALRALTNESGIDKWRGSILPLHPRFQLPNVKVVPSYSPREMWAQDDKPFVIMQWDFGKAVRMRELKDRFIPAENVWIVKNSLELYNWWQRAENAEFITLDIETHHGFVTCIGFSHNGTEAISVPLLVGSKLDYSSRAKLYQLVDKILRSKVPKVNQNIKYDWTVLETFGFDIKNIIGDTMLLAHTIYPEFEKGLGFLNSIYTDLPFYKDEGKKFDPRIHSIERLLKYNARDALCTWQIWKSQLNDAEAFGVKNFYFKHVHPAFYTYKRMDQYGIRVDDSQRKKLITEYEPQFWKLKSTINLIAEEDININSPAQVGKFIYDILKCPKKTHTTKGGDIKYSTEEETIEDLYVNQVSDSGRKSVLHDLIFARKLARVLQFLRSPISPDGRMRTSYKLSGTETGRTSAGKSIEPYFQIDKGKIREKECGGSFQTIPKHGFEFGRDRLGADLRSIFVPTNGYCFIEGDQGQAEDRVVCVLAEDWEGLKILNKKEFKRNKYGLKDDRHVITAILVTSKPFEEITPDDRQERGKKPRHAGNYNMGPGMLAILTHLSHRECSRLLDTFHATNPKIRGVFHEGIRQIINTKRYLISPHGRRRDFFGRVTEDMYKQAYSTIPQATVSDHSKFGILRSLVEKYPEPECFPLAESHDSVTFEVKIEHKEAFAEDFSRYCEMPINFSGCSLSRDYDLVIPADVAIGMNNWMEMVKC